MPEKINLKNISARVDEVLVQGIHRTREDYLNKATEGIFKARNFQDVIDESVRAKAYLESLGAFSSVSVKIDTSKTEFAGSNDYTVTFEVHELSRLTGSIGSDVGQNQGSVVAELTSPNFMGRGECVRFQGSLSHRQNTDLSLKFWKPFYHTSFVDYRPQASVNFFRNFKRIDISAYRTMSVGLLADFSFDTLLPFPIRHSLQYEFGQRHIDKLTKSVPWRIRSYCGPRLISVFRHIATYDSRNSKIFPTEGLYANSTQELNGIGRDSSFWVHNAQLELNIPLFSGVVAQFTNRCGLIQGLKGRTEFPLNNLFLFGGIQSLRGFKFGGVGPCVGGATLGVDSFWSAGFHLWAPLPFSSSFKGIGNHFRTHVFYNLGSRSCLDEIRSAAGVGLALKLGEIARFELNYCVPLSSQPADRLKQGLQFDFGVDFI